MRKLIEVEFFDINRDGCSTANGKIKRIIYDKKRGAVKKPLKL